MRKLFLLLFIGFLPLVLHAQTAKAIWCAGNTTLYFTYDTNTYAAGGNYNGQTITNVYTVNVADGYNSTSIPWYSIRTSITNVTVASNFYSFKPISLSYWFNGCTNLTTTTGLNYINTSEVRSMGYTFYDCRKVTLLEGLSNWNTSNVSTMANMFGYCSALTSLDGLNNWDTSNVSNISYMFYYCSNISSLEPLRNWDTSRVTDMGTLFYECRKVTSLEPLNSWNTGSVTNLSWAFARCSLNSLEGLSNWNTSNVTNMSYMFQLVSSLTSLEPLSGWNTSNVTTMVDMFNQCTGITSLEPLRNWDTGNVTNTSYMFEECNNISSLDPLRNWNTSKVTNMRSMFESCSKFNSLVPLQDWDTSNVTNMASTFRDCSSISSLEPLRNWNTSKVTDMSSTFQACFCSSLEPLSGWNTSNVTTMRRMFYECYYVTSLEPLKNWSTGKVTNMESMFEYCNRLTSLEPLSGWNTSNVTTMKNMFSYCSALTSADLSGWNTNKVTDMTMMFYRCANLPHITFGENFNMNKVTSSNNMFQSCSKLRYIDFYNCNYATSGSGLQFPLNTVNRSSGTFNGVPATTVIFLPKGDGVVTDVTNVVYSYNGNDNDLRCHDYYSADKVDIEFPLDFKTNEAVYTRAMSNSYGSVVLPYAFTTNDNIQAYTLDAEHTETMYFKDIATVPAHTPFAFKKLASGSTADFTMTDSNNNFGITVRATHSTNATEDTWTDSKGAPYVDVSNINMGAGSNVTGWSTKGYYVNETVSDYDGAFYIASDRFYKANGALTMYPHRVTFHGAWTLGGSNNAKSYAIGTGSNLLETAIEAADLRKTEREADAIYDMQGRKVEKLQHGLNIVRMSDGTVRKVISNK